MNDKNQWRPTADIDTLKKRAHLLRLVRQYFEQAQVLEVETPVLSHFSATDVQLSQWQTVSGHSLHTSPEFAMKRLLAAGSGDIYQLCKVFRCDEEGQRHNPEFTMLEWYRLGMDEFELMDDVYHLVVSVTGQADLATQQLTYREAFLSAQLPDPHCASDTDLKDAVRVRLASDASRWTRDDCLDALMAMVVEPSLPKDKLCFVYQYPKSQAALAEHIEVDGVTVARRFEVYWQGMELANGYFELTDVQEQRRRFQAELSIKQAAQLTGAPLQTDRLFLQALEHGLPRCSGVALGFDRLVMIALAKQSIQDVISFSFDRA